jgi:hypothetical protein
MVRHGSLARRERQFQNLRCERTRGGICQKYVTAYGDTVDGDRHAYYRCEGVVLPSAPRRTQCGVRVAYRGPLRRGTIKRARRVVQAPRADHMALRQHSSGPITNLKGLDRELGRAPALHVVHASRGVDKTTFCLQVAATSPVPVVQWLRSTTQWKLKRLRSSQSSVSGSVE